MSARFARKFFDGITIRDRDNGILECVLETLDESCLISRIEIFRVAPDVRAGKALENDGFFVIVEKRCGFLVNEHGAVLRHECARFKDQMCGIDGHIREFVSYRSGLYVDEGAYERGDERKKDPGRAAGNAGRAYRLAPCAEGKKEYEDQHPDEYTQPVAFKTGTVEALIEIEQGNEHKERKCVAYEYCVFSVR